MTVIKYNKLVRDKIPGISASKGIISKTHVAGDEEYWRELRKKLREEAAEFEKEESAKELGDVLEVIYSIAAFKGWKLYYVEELRKKKREERGGFEGRIILEENRVTEPVSDKFAEELRMKK